jgi:hypothetical protein
VATLDHIIASKEAANRPSDLEALPELRALRAAELAGQAYPRGIQAALTDPEPQEGREATAGEDLEHGRRCGGDDQPGGPPRRSL